MRQKISPCLVLLPRSCLAFQNVAVSQDVLRCWFVGVSLGAGMDLLHAVRDPSTPSALCRVQAPVDEAWISQVDEASAKQLEKSESDLSSSRTHLIKESIRVWPSRGRLVGLARALANRFFCRTRLSKAGPAWPTSPPCIRL